MEPVGTPGTIVRLFRLLAMCEKDFGGVLIYVLVLVIGGIPVSRIPESLPDHKNLPCLFIGGHIEKSSSVITPKHLKQRMRLICLLRGTESVINAHNFSGNDIKGTPAPQLQAFTACQTVRSMLTVWLPLPRRVSGRAKLLGIPVRETLVSWFWRVTPAFRNCGEADSAMSQKNRARREFKQARWL